MGNDYFFFQLNAFRPADESRFLFTPTRGEGWERVNKGRAAGGWKTLGHRSSARPAARMRPGSPPHGCGLPARGFLRAQRPALFPGLCFKYLTTIPPIPAPNPRPGCRRSTRAHCGAERGAKGAGGGPLGTLLFRPVDSAIWVTRAESWACVQRMRWRGVSSCLFSPQSQK